MKKLITINYLHYIPAILLLLLLTNQAGVPAKNEYVRLFPNDGNCVYPARDLLRSWPDGGPHELWRLRIGEGKAAVVEAGGKAYTGYQADGKQWAVCLDPRQAMYSGNGCSSPWRTIMEWMAWFRLR